MSEAASPPGNARRGRTAAGQAGDGPVLRAVDIRKSFGRLDVLIGVSLELREGDRIALIGASGSGKSTFLRCLNYIERPSGGHVYLDGALFGEKLVGDRYLPMNERELAVQRRRIGMVFQDFNLWPHLTALDNVAIAPYRVQGRSRSAARELAAAALAKVRMQHKEGEYPDRLSGGQQQRVAIARALAQDPRVILFDEPTSALDPELVGEVLRVIHELADEGLSMVLVTHEIRFAAEVSSRIAFIDGGRLAEIGPPAEVLEQPRSPRLRQFLSHILQR
jgi:polar amino acid transport system ATP-binding protein